MFVCLFVCLFVYVLPTTPLHQQTVFLRLFVTPPPLVNRQCCLFICLFVSLLAFYLLAPLPHSEDRKNFISNERGRGGEEKRKRKKNKYINKERFFFCNCYVRTFKKTKEKKYYARVPLEKKYKES